MKKTGIICILATLMVLTSCGIEKTEKSQFPVTVREVQIKEKPQRVVSLSPALTTSLYSLGYGNRLVGVDRRSDRPTAAENLPDCGTALSPDVEQILALTPSVVFTPSPLPEQEANALLREDIAIITITPGGSTQDIVYRFHDLITAMDGLNKGALAKEQLSYYADATTNYLLQSMRTVTQGKTAIYIAEMNFNLATNDTYMGYMLEGMGFTNQASGEYTNWDFPAEMEKDLNPDYIFYSDHISEEEITTSPYYTATKASKSGQLIPLDNKILEQQPPFLFEYLFTEMKENFPDAFNNPRPSIAIEPIIEEEPTGFWAKIQSFFN